ncbi:hypothetical protein SHIRM173S_13321 [Streptomyces hirsutus]
MSQASGKRADSRRPDQRRVAPAPRAAHGRCGCAGTRPGRRRADRRHSAPWRGPAAARPASIPTPEGFGSVGQAPYLPAGLRRRAVQPADFVQANGIRQHVVVGGEGPPLLPAYTGWPETWYAWRLVMPELARTLHGRRRRPTRHRADRETHEAARPHDTPARLAPRLVRRRARRLTSPAAAAAAATSSGLVTSRRSAERSSSLTLDGSRTRVDLGCSPLRSQRPGERVSDTTIGPRHQGDRSLDLHRVSFPLPPVKHSRHWGEGRLCDGRP